ncbi:TPA: hypothetical protein ACL9MO_005346, partial [Klebsiella pneumoniae]
LVSTIQKAAVFIIKLICALYIMSISLDSLGYNPLHSDNILKGFIFSCVITIGAAKISDYIVTALLNFIKLVIREIISSNSNFFEKK